MMDIKDDKSFYAEAGVLLRSGQFYMPETGVFSIIDALLEAAELPKSIAANPDLFVWTYCDGDGDSFLWAGIHMANSLGYLLTKVRGNDKAFDIIRDADGAVKIRCHECVNIED
ncbi:MAG: hypothetical protein V1799_07865 [bacterium]